MKLKDYFNVCPKYRGLLQTFFFSNLATRGRRDRLASVCRSSKLIKYIDLIELLRAWCAYEMKKIITMSMQFLTENKKIIKQTPYHR